MSDGIRCGRSTNGSCILTSINLCGEITARFQRSADLLYVGTEPARLWKPLALEEKLVAVTVGYVTLHRLDTEAVTRCKISPILYRGISSGDPKWLSPPARSVKPVEGVGASRERKPNRKLAPIEETRSLTLLTPPAYSAGKMRSSETLLQA